MLVQFTDKGFYVPAADVYIDPWRAVDKAIVTHAHADHARYGCGQYISTPLTEVVLRYRLKTQSTTSYPYGETFTIRGVQFSFHPAGHIIGSAQVRIEYRGEIWVLSGDYKTQADGLVVDFEPVPCHHFVSECTFGLPVFKWKKNEVLSSEINHWWEANKKEGKASLLLGYSLGKAQRLLGMVDTSIGPIYTHGAIENINQVLREAKYSLPETQYIDQHISKDQLKGSLIIAPPSAIGSTWVKRLGPYTSAMASGWMQMRGARRRRGSDTGFIVSDHADWDGLLSAIKETGAENIYVTHGYTELFNRYLNEHGFNSNIVSTEYEVELEETLTLQ